MSSVSSSFRCNSTVCAAPSVLCSNRGTGGGLQARTLDDLLRDDVVGGVLGDDVVTYLRVLLTDPRGWNIRNNVCHGLAPAGMLTMPVADRVVHAVLVPALLRVRDEQSGAGDETAK